MRRTLNGLLFDCCNLIERMMYDSGVHSAVPFLPISFGSVMLLHNAVLYLQSITIFRKV